MSLSLTINNINDLTDAERAVLRYVLDGVPMTDELRERRPLIDAAKVAMFSRASIGSSSGCTSQPEVSINTDRPMTSIQIESLKDAITDASGGTFSANVYGAPTPPAAPASSSPIVEGPGGGGGFPSGDQMRVPLVPKAPTPASAELDTNGLPWDKRIHSSSRAKVADGRWRYLRGVEPALITEVEAELRAVQAIPVPAPQVTYVGDGSGVHGVGTEVVPGLNTDPNEIPPAGCYPEPVTSVPVPPAPAPAAPLTFADLMKHVTPMLVSGKLPQDTLLAVTAEFGLPHLAALGARPDLVEAVRARIDEVCK